MRFILLASSLSVLIQGFTLTRDMVDKAPIYNSSTDGTFMNFAKMGITDIAIGAFDGSRISAVQSLYLMGNSIKSFPNGLFQSFSALKNLYAGSNQISKIDSGFDCREQLIF
jgi:Leucine-rich repeat (LRR) protein